jgi:hypothetical protein
MLSLLNQTVDEYSVTFTVGDTGIQKPAYTKGTSYRARLETVNKELIERQYGLAENIDYRMFTLTAPTLGRFILINNVYYRIRLVIPIQGKQTVHHYESLLVKVE